MRPLHFFICVFPMSVVLFLLGCQNETKMLQSAESLYQQGDFKKANQICQKIINSKPKPEVFSRTKTLLTESAVAADYVEAQSIVEAKYSRKADSLIVYSFSNQKYICAYFSRDSIYILSAVSGEWKEKYSIPNIGYILYGTIDNLQFVTIDKQPYLYYELSSGGNAMGLRDYILFSLSQKDTFDINFVDNYREGTSTVNNISPNFSSNPQIRKYFKEKIGFMFEDDMPFNEAFNDYCKKQIGGAYNIISMDPQKANNGNWIWPILVIRKDLTPTDRIDKEFLINLFKCLGDFLVGSNYEGKNDKKLKNLTGQGSTLILIQSKIAGPRYMIGVESSALLMCSSNGLSWRTFVYDATDSYKEEFVN